MTDRTPEAIGASEADGTRFGRSGDSGHALSEMTLDSLRRADGPLPLVEVACRIVTENSERGPPVAPREEVQRVYLSLVRYEVPRLEQRDIVEYSQDEGTLQLVGPRTP